MKGLVLEPTIADEQVLVQFTAEISVDKHISVKAPKGYQAVVIVDEKAIARVPSGAEKKIIEYGKQWLNKKARVAFVRSQVSSDMAWGFGNIRVNNERLQEAYTVGANGKYSVEITEVGKLLNGFSGEENVTTDIIREKTIATVKNIGTALLAKYFANTDTSIFEISAHTTEIRKEMIAVLKDEIAFNTLGIKLHDLTVEGVHIPEEDLALIKGRINANSNASQQSHIEQNSDFDDALIKITEKLNALEMSLKKYGETQADNKSDFTAIKQEIEEALAERLAENSADLQERIESVISAKVSEEASLWKDTLLAGLDERLQSAEKGDKPQVIATEYSAESLISNAQKEMDYLLAASMIYSCVEDRLINVFHLQHQNKKFVIPYTEYLELADSATINTQHDCEHGKSLTKAEEELLKTATANSSYKNAFMLALYTGLRPNEINTVRIEGDMIIAVNSKRKNRNIEYKRIPICKMLKPYIVPEGYANYSVEYMREYFKKILPTHRLYDLRTTFHSRLKECGVEKAAREEFMGHSAGKLEDAYTDLSDEYLIKEMAKFEY